MLAILKNKFINPLKRLTYLPIVSNLVWKLGLAGSLRRLYYWLNRPKGGLACREIGGVTIQYHVRTPWELRALDPVGEMGREQHVLEKLSSLVKLGDVVFDVGSNFGVFSIPLAKIVGDSGSVVAFEPEPQAYEHLLDNVKLNQLINVRAFQLALSDKSSEASLYLQHTGASRLDGPTVLQEGNSIVKLVTGDALIVDENIPIPRAIKIDVEGHEWAVICGLQNTLMDPRCEYVLCEVHPQLLPNDIGSEKLLDYLKSLGFLNIEILQRGTTEFHVLASK